MADTSSDTPGITSLQDRIAILEDLIAFHCERNVTGAVEILRIATDLNNADLSDRSAAELRATIAYAFADLTRLGRELAIDSLDSEEARAALSRWPFVASYPERLS